MLSAAASRRVLCRALRPVPTGESAAVASLRSLGLQDRFFSSGGASGTGDSRDGDGDPFGVNYDDDATGGMGPESDKPPSFVRDATTGKLTGEIEAELTDKERRLLNMTQADKARLLADRFVSSWNSQEDEAVDSPSNAKGSREAEIADRIRTEQMAMNVIGRSAADVAASISADGAEEDYTDPDQFSAPLSPSEFKTLQKYVKQEHGIDDITEDDIPVSRTASGANGASIGNTTTDPDLDLTWLTSAAQAEIDGTGAESDPFIDLMPSDLNPARKVNRKRAKPLPQELLHHNNLSLLRRFVTPGGQIMNRVRSRLGAKDQRKVAKLIKRARHLGIIPHLGQWKLEDHGNIHEEDIRLEREWERDLAARGLLSNTSEHDSRTRNM